MAGFINIVLLTLGVILMIIPFNDFMFGDPPAYTTRKQVAAVLVGLVLVSGSMIGALRDPQIETEQNILISTQTLKSLGEDSVTSGTFSSSVFAGRGQIGEDYYFFGYVDVGDGAVNLERWPAKISTIVFDDSQPRVDNYGYEVTARTYYAFGVFPIREERRESKVVNRHRITVPPGSLREDFTLNSAL